MKSSEFQQFLTGLRRRDERAVEELVRHYEPLIRRVIRMRLTDARLRRVVDSQDIYQSILAHFFAEAGRGGFDLDSPQQLRNLLVTMAVNKVIDKARHERRHAGSLPEGWEPSAPELPPTELVAQQELAEVILCRLTEKERWLVEQQALGRGWTELAQETGDTPSALRMMHVRALLRVRRQLEGEA
jgi:DNA-directed RNA polymerase specialized sigma24 family protein